MLNIKPNFRRVLILATAFLVLTIIAGFYLYNSFKRIFEIPEKFPLLLPSEGFWNDFATVYFYSPVKTIVLVFGFYMFSLFLIKTIDKYMQERKTLNQNVLKIQND